MSNQTDCRSDHRDIRRSRRKEGKNARGEAVASGHHASEATNYRLLLDMHGCKAAAGVIVTYVTPHPEIYPPSSEALHCVPLPLKAPKDIRNKSRPRDRRVSHSEIPF
jgi:hypothetical protein